MLLQNEICNISISIDNTYSVESADNRYYDLILNPDKFKHNDFYKTMSIHIELLAEKISIALVGDYYSYDTDCAILDVDILTVLQNDKITQINIYDGTMILHKQFECLGCNFGIYKVKYGYIIYGEIEITMLDLEFNKVWSFSGRDIFVSRTNRKSFELCDNSIKLYDFEENYYEIGYDGNILVEKKSCENDVMNITDCANMLADLTVNGKQVLEEHKENFHEILLHVLAGELVTEPLIDLLKYHMDKRTAICEYCKVIEDMWKNGDDAVINVVDVTILERLSDEKDVWQRFGSFISDEFKNYINNEVLRFNLMLANVKSLE